jgi:hypothetical protein
MSRYFWFFLVPLLAQSQDKPASQPVSTRLVANAARAQRSAFVGSFAPVEVKIVGYLDYGQISPPVNFSDSPHYRAFAFSGYGGDTVDVSLNGAGRTAFVAVADSTLKGLVGGTERVRVTLPDHGPDLEVWYVLFRDLENKPGRFTVQVKKVGNQQRQVEASLPASESLNAR